MTDTPSIKRTTLPNGLEIATDHMPGVETVSFGAYVAAGTRHEEEAHNGVAHFLEHMAFKGTAKRSSAAIAEVVENVGGAINAYTARENTAYYVKLLKGDLALGVDIIGDILTGSLFAPEEIERERGVILQEIGQANDMPDDVAFDTFQATAYPSQPMGWPTLGPAATIAAMGRDALTGYMKRHYSTRNTVIAAAGNLDHDELVRHVAQAFASLPSAEVPKAMPARYVGGRVHTPRDLDQVHFMLGFEAPSYRDDTYYAAMVLSTLLGGGMSSRLFQEIREKRGLVYSVYSFVSPYEDSGVFGIHAGTGPEKLAELVPVLIDELRRLDQPVQADELARARAQLKASLLMARESTGSRCGQLARQIQVHGRPIPVEETVARIEAVTADDIIAIAQKMLSSSPVVSTVGMAEGEFAPETISQALKR
ncbi:insulinase family protein [Formicincola oecophyllae]|uniref:Insulinase family protein n=1 Tax=Formicincola oecophyllae TaxID=2558361 RepID=A0A4Y6UBS0_9PROT|nr:pitrilysin family protein [Formicincola oecophyllae]QDH13917.1 insulinase family protein [Formicincola oecophyllae]